MVNKQESLIEEEHKKFSSTRREVNSSIFLKLAIFIFLILYLYSLFFGESSIGVLQLAKERFNKLNSEYNKIQNENQKLQKKHFELIQLTPEEDTF